MMLLMKDKASIEEGDDLTRTLSQSICHKGKSDFPSYVDVLFKRQKIVMFLRVGGDIGGTTYTTTTWGEGQTNSSVGIMALFVVLMQK